MNKVFYLSWDGTTFLYGFKVPIFCKGNASMLFVSKQIQLKMVTNFITDNCVHNGTSLWSFTFFELNINRIGLLNFHVNNNKKILRKKSI